MPIQWISPLSLSLETFCGASLVLEVPCGVTLTPVLFSLRMPPLSPFPVVHQGVSPVRTLYSQMIACTRTALIRELLTGLVLVGGWTPCPCSLMLHEMVAHNYHPLQQTTWDKDECWHFYLCSRGSSM